MAITSRDNKFKIDIWLGKGVDGKYKRHTEKFNGTYEEAEARESQLKKQLLHNINENKNITLEEFYYIWLKRYNYKLKKEKFFMLFKSNILPILGKKKLNSITSIDINKTWLKLDLNDNERYDLNIIVDSVFNTAKKYKYVTEVKYGD